MLGEKECPICKNHCSLTSPKCGRGRKYAETIELPIKSHEKDKKSLKVNKLEGYCIAQTVIVPENNLKAVR